MLINVPRRRGSSTLNPRTSGQCWWCSRVTWFRHFGGRDPPAGPAPQCARSRSLAEGASFPRIRQNQGTVGTMPEPSLGHSAGERTGRDAMGREVTREC